MFSIQNNNTFQIKYQKLNQYAIIPTKGSEDAAGYDLYAAISQPILIPSHSTVKITTGLAFELPKGYFAGIFARSGLATKQGLRPANCVGICDSDYRGPYIVALHNDTNEDKIIKPKQKIAQMILLPCQNLNFVEKELSNTQRGEGGFGSTDK